MSSGLTRYPSSPSFSPMLGIFSISVIERPRVGVIRPILGMLQRMRSYIAAKSWLKKGDSSCSV